MGEPKRFYWLKLKEDFFRQKEIKKLRRIAGGDVFTIIYLKMLLRAMKDNGKLYYEGVESNFADELALDIDEDEDNVKMTVAFLMANGIMVENQPDEYELLTMDEMTGSECESAHRVRRLREQKALQCNAAVTPCNDAVTDSNAAVTACNVEIEIENRDRVRDKSVEIENRDKSIGAKARRFTPPTLEQLKAYIAEKGFTSDEIDPEYFIDYYTSNGWICGKSKMKDWQATVNNWVRRYRKDHPAPAPQPDPAPYQLGFKNDEEKARYDEMIRREQIEMGLIPEDMK